MATYTKNQILSLAGSNKGEDIYAASQKYGFTPADVDAAWGAAPGTSQSWVDKNITDTSTRDKIASGQIAPVQGYAVAQTAPAEIKTAETVKPAVTGYTPGSFSADGYTADTYNATGYDAQTRGSDSYTAATGNLNKWNVDPNQLVEKRVAGLIASESPLLQLAETKAKQRMNEKGLLSSSMALGEGERAVIETATPIASQDAATLARQGEFNASQGNLMEQFNVGQKNVSLQFNAQESNKAKSDNQTALNRASEFLANAQNIAAGDNTAAKNRAIEFTTQAKNVAQELTTKARNDAAAFRAQAENAANTAEAAEANRAAQDATRVANEAQVAYTAAVNREKELQAQATNDLNRDKARIDADAALQKLDATTRKEIQELANEAQNRSTTSAASNDLYLNTMAAIDSIMNNSDLDPAAKQAAVNTQRDNLKTGLDFLSATSGIEGLAELINFNDIGNAGEETTPTPDSNPSTGNASESYPYPNYSGY